MEPVIVFEEVISVLVLHCILAEIMVQIILAFLILILLELLENQLISLR